MAVVVFDVETDVIVLVSGIVCGEVMLVFGVVGLSEKIIQDTTDGKNCLK